jgi:hypothetical protein
MERRENEMPMTTLTLWPMDKKKMRKDDFGWTKICNVRYLQKRWKK